jgi:hypothetical protein
MSLVSLLNVPKNKDEWESWSWANKTILLKIRAAIQTKYNVNLTEYQIYPIDFNKFQDFLWNNSQYHNDFNSTLNLQSSDLTSVDIKNESQLQNWIYLNFHEIQNASNVLQV